MEDAMVRPPPALDTSGPERRRGCTRRDGCLAGTNPRPSDRPGASRAASRGGAGRGRGAAEGGFRAVGRGGRPVAGSDFAALGRYDPQDAITIAGTWTRT